jgi:hypothetical protein
LTVDVAFFPSTALRRAACLGLLGLAGCGPESTSIAKVNGQSISLAEYKRQLLILQSIKPDTVLDEATRKQVLDQMVRQELLVQMAQKEGLDADPAVKVAMEVQRQSVKRELEATLANTQAQLAQLDHAVQQKILIERLLQTHSELSASPEELQKAYASEQGPAGSKALPPLAQMKAQLTQEVYVDKLLAKARQGADLEMHPELVSAP